MTFKIHCYRTEIIGVILVFSYIFSFYIVGPITSSIVAGILLFPCFVSVKFRKNVLRDLVSPYVSGIFIFQWLLIIVGYIYSIFHATYDLTYIKILFAQSIHLFFGVFIVVFLKYKLKCTFYHIERYIICAYMLQSIIQLVASIIPVFANLMLYFNRADSLQERSEGVRGLALAGATGWSLALTYGLVFIVFAKCCMLGKINLKTILCWGILFVGTFFAGRTGFIGIILGGVFFLFYNNRSLITKAWYVIKLLLLIIMLCVLIYILFPTYVEFALEYVLPFAFEPIYNYLDGNGFSSRSTNILLDDMWAISLSTKDFLLGTGHFTNPDGSYYQYTDAGILRNLLYWGAGGYFLLIVYQFYLLRPLRYCRSRHFPSYFYWGLIMLFLAITEYKAVVIGLNKCVFSILFLLGYFYTKERKELFKNTI